MRAPLIAVEESDTASGSLCPAGASAVAAPSIGCRVIRSTGKSLRSEDPTALPPRCVYAPSTARKGLAVCPAICRIANVRGLSPVGAGPLRTGMIGWTRTGPPGTGGSGRM